MADLHQAGEGMFYGLQEGQVAVPKKRGRPKKPETLAREARVAAGVEPPSGSKKRGRPKKVEGAAGEARPAVAAGPSASPPGGKKRGRPRKTDNGPEAPVEEGKPKESPGKKRGRPKKDVAAAQLPPQIGGNGVVMPDSSGQRMGAPVILFAHGAGQSSSSDWMKRWKALLEQVTRAADVMTFDYPYLAEGKRGAPPKAEKLIPFHQQMMKHAMEAHPGHPIVLCGKSMGSRIGCMLAGDPSSRPDAVICLGYPLKGGKSLRDQTLLDILAPVLFIQGTKDAMCPLDELEKVRVNMKVANDVYEVMNGDHGLQVGARTKKELGLSQEQLDMNAAMAIRTFLQNHLPPW